MFGITKKLTSFTIDFINLFCSFKPVKSFGGPFDFHKAYFIHIPKAAGTSISMSLFGHQVGHDSFREIYKINPVKAEKYFSFAFVRHPIDRFISAYYFLADGGMVNKDKQYLAKVLSKFKDINEFVEYLDESKIYEQVHFIPQYEFLCDDFSDKPKVSFIGKYEQIDEDYNFVINKLEVKKQILLKNVSKLNKNSVNLSQQSILKLQKLYEKDFYLFGYTLN